ncbi:MAG: polysaccharide pyruvyl transferase CsaB [Fimbriimonadales bacterium]|nr:polysaccharide pyruvyl transferase CsaB [Fimbriimonadales bacterium]
MRVVIAGYYGYRNWGDEGALATLLQAIAHGSERAVQAQPVQICVLSADPAFTKATYGVSAIPRMGLRAIRRTIRGSDALIFGGGSLLQDATSLRSLLYYLALVRWGVRTHGRVLLVGQGMGPLRRCISRVLVRATLRKVPFLSVRDEQSAGLLRKLGVAHATVDADLTWMLAPQPPHYELDADSRWMGLAPRCWEDAPVQQAFTALCRQIQAHGYRALLIPMQETQDRALCEAIAEASGACVLPPPTHPAQLLGAIRSLEGMVAMRLHGAIFAASQGVPTLCISYDPKVEAFAKPLGLPALSLETLSGHNLSEVWTRFVAECDSLRAQLPSRTARMRDAAAALLARVRDTLSSIPAVPAAPSPPATSRDSRS